MPEWVAKYLGAATTSPSNRGHASFVHILALIALRLCCVPCGALIDGPVYTVPSFMLRLWALLVNDGRNCFGFLGACCCYQVRVKI
jgi:hypothetical protein